MNMKHLKRCMFDSDFYLREIVEMTGRFSVLFLVGRFSDICAGCNYPTRNANFKRRILDIQLKLVFLVTHFLCHS